MDERPARLLGAGGCGLFHHIDRPWARPAPGSAVDAAHAKRPGLHRGRLRPRLLARPGGPRGTHTWWRARHLPPPLPGPGAGAHGARAGLRRARAATEPGTRQLPSSSQALTGLARPPVDRYAGEGRAAV